MNIAVLKSEIESDPLEYGYSEMTDQEIVDSLNTVDISIYQSISSAELLAWSGNNSRYMKLKNASEDTENTDAIRSICFTALEMIKRDETSLDLNLSDRVAMLDALISASVLEASDKTALETLATTTISRATQLGLSFVRMGDIQEAKI